MWWIEKRAVSWTSACKKIYSLPPFRKPKEMTIFLILHSFLVVACSSLFAALAGVLHGLGFTQTHSTVTQNQIVIKVVLYLKIINSFLVTKKSKGWSLVFGPLFQDTEMCQFRDFENRVKEDPKLQVHCNTLLTLATEADYHKLIITEFP